MPTVCPALHTREQIVAAQLTEKWFASPVPLPYTRTLTACSGRFDDPNRDGWSGQTPPPWGAEDTVIGHNGNDLGTLADAPYTAIAAGTVARVNLIDTYDETVSPPKGDAAGVWLAVLHDCPEHPTHKFADRGLHLKTGSILVKVGDQVVKGQKLATCDTTGSAHWRHLHFDLRHSVNPAGQSPGFGPTWGIPYDPQVFGIAQTPPPPLVPVPTPPPTWPATLRVGDDHPMVARLRNLLRAIAIAGETRFGSTLDAAVREYQKSRGLVVDGIVGANTRAELDKDAANLI